MDDCDLRWPSWLGTASVEVLVGEVDLDMDGFEVVLEPEFTLVLVKVKGLGGAGALRELIDSNSSFPVILTPSMVLATLETFRHMLGFRSSMSCLGLGLWLGYLDGHIGYKFGELFGSKLESLSFGLWVRFLAYCGGIGFLVVDHMLPECLLFIFGTPPCKMQHVALNSWHTWAVLLLFLGILCVNGSHHREVVPS